MAIWGLVVEGKLGWTGVLIGMGITFALFLVGVLSTVEKARAINMRKGFLSALVRHLRGEIDLKEYKGWAQLKVTFAECGARRKALACPMGHGHKDKDTCRDEGESMAASINAAKRIVPGVMDSFTSLSATIYTVIYVALVAVVGYSLTQEYSQSGKIIFWHIPRAFAIGIAVSVFVVRGRWFILGMVFLFFVLLAASLFDEGWVATLSAIGILGGILGSLGVFLAAQLNSLRMGKHSHESYAYSWGIVLNNCNPFPSNADKLPIRPPGILYGALLFLLKADPHGKVRAEYEINKGHHKKQPPPSS